MQITLHEHDISVHITGQCTNVFPARIMPHGCKITFFLHLYSAHCVHLCMCLKYAFSKVHYTKLYIIIHNNNYIYTVLKILIIHNNNYVYSIKDFNNT